MRISAAWHWPLWAMIGLLLLAPLVAMQFTREVNWTSFDFAVAAALLVGAGLAYEVAMRMLKGRTARLSLAAALAGAVLLVWAEGAVGIFTAG